MNKPGQTTFALTRLTRWGARAGKRGLSPIWVR